MTRRLSILLLLLPFLAIGQPTPPTNAPASSQQQLSAMRQKLSAEAGRLIDARLDAATAEYQAAADGLQNACVLMEPKSARKKVRRAP